MTDPKQEPADLKGCTVNAEHLRRLFQETNLTSEEKIVIILARLEGGKLPRHLAPKGRGLADWEIARCGLNARRMADAPMMAIQKCDLLETTYPELAPKGKNVRKRKPSAADSTPTTNILAPTSSELSGPSGSELSGPSGSEPPPEEVAESGSSTGPSRESSDAKAEDSADDGLPSSSE